MTSVLQVVLTLVSVTLGAVTSYVFTRLDFRSKWRREQSIRWDEKRLETYAEYGTAVRNQQFIVMSVGAWRGFTARLVPIDATSGLPQIVAAEAKRAATYEKLLLLGEPAGIAAARRWHHAVWHLDWFARGHFTDSEQWAGAVNELEAARAEFYNVARRDLGVVGDLPAQEAPWWFGSIPRGSATGSFQDT